MMIARVKAGVVFISALLILFSCKSYRSVTSEGRFKTYVRSYKYPALVFPMTITGKRTVVDTVTNRVVERSYYRTSLGPFRHRNIDRTITYDGQNRKEREVIVENGRRTTIEYIRSN